jgi:hypothetical protein
MQATLGEEVSGLESRIVLKCKVGDGTPISLCNLLPGKSETVRLNIEFEEETDILFTVLGPCSVHISGNYLKSKYPDPSFCFLLPVVDILHAECCSCDIITHIYIESTIFILFTSYFYEFTWYESRNLPWFGGELVIKVEYIILISHNSLASCADLLTLDLNIFW